MDFRAKEFLDFFSRISFNFAHKMAYKIVWDAKNMRTDNPIVSSDPKIG
jgi:hypothetical protein